PSFGAKPSAGGGHHVGLAKGLSCAGAGTRTETGTATRTATGRRGRAVRAGVRTDSPGLLLVHVNGVVVGLLDLPRVEIGQKHFVADATGVLVIEAPEHGPDAGVSEYRFFQIGIISKMPQVLMGEHYMKASFSYLIEHRGDVVGDVLLDLIQVKN